MGYTNLVTFCDDGVSGVTMDRPGFNAMMAELELAHASAVFVKDMSRLRRNYIEVGRLIEEFFPEHDIRLVAISDSMGTEQIATALTEEHILTPRFNWESKGVSVLVSR